MELGSHNSWSFLPVKQWYLKPFAWTAKCQQSNIQIQYVHGVRCFDLRLRYNKEKDIWETAHGLITYERGEEWKRDLQQLNFFVANKPKVYCRVLLEDTKREQSEETDKKFAEICEWLEFKFENIIFFGGFPARRRWGQYIYKFKGKEPSLDDKYSSVIPPKIRGLWPWLYAKMHNAENLKKKTDKDFLFIDFVNIRG